MGEKERREKKRKRKIREKEKRGRERGREGKKDKPYHSVFLSATQGLIPRSFTTIKLDSSLDINYLNKKINHLRVGLFSLCHQHKKKAFQQFSHKTWLVKFEKGHVLFPM